MSKWLGICLVLLLGACGPGRVGPGGPALTFRENDLTYVEGTLVEARCFLNTGAVGGDHTFCAFRSAKANLPLALLTQEGQLLLLTGTPERLADYVTEHVRIWGQATPNLQLLRPSSVYIRRAETWVYVPQ